MKVVLNADGAAGRGPFVLPPHAKQGNPDMSETAHGLKDFIVQTKRLPHYTAISFILDTLSVFTVKALIPLKYLY